MIELFPPSLPPGAHSVGGKWAGAYKCRPTGLPKWLGLPAPGRAGPLLSSTLESCGLSDFKVPDQ